MSETEALRKSLIGRVIKDVRQMTDKEREEEGWDSGTVVLILDNDTKLYASRDEEGNDAGVLFGETKEGRGLRFY